MKQTRVIIYSRVSTENQDTTRQERELENYCKVNNYYIVKKIAEKVSGTISWEKRELNSIFGEEDFDGVLVWELSRLGRNTNDVLTIIGKLTERKIWVHSLNNNNLRTLDENGKEDNMSKLMLTILSSIAELERTTTIERSLSGLANSIKQGNWTGGKYLPYGYKRIDKKLVIDEDEAIIVKKIFSLHNSGNGTSRIASILNQKNIPTRYNKVVKDKVKVSGLMREGSSFKWASGTIYSVLTNRVYIGEKTGRKKLSGLNISSPSIIDKDLFEITQIRLKDTNTRTSTRFLYVLHGKTKCGSCGRTYYPHKRISNKDNAYKCLSKRYGESCDNYGIGIPKLNNGVWTALRTNQNELENILDISKNKNVYQKDIVELKEKEKFLETEIKNQENMEQRMISLYIKGSFGDEVLEKTHNDIKNELLRLKAELSNTKNEIISKKDFISKQFTASNYLRRIKDDVFILKKTFDKVISKIIIHPVLLNKIPETFENKQDKLVYIELYTFINLSKPICFVISQRTSKILFINEGHSYYDLKTKSLLLNKNIEEEEEGDDMIFRNLIEIDNLSKTIFIKSDEDKVDKKTIKKKSIKLN
jgi:site-specific DNA recombinase